ncbi:hypothetical protein EV646_10162 [Kribbella antiqua]|uniref:Uncharacterized protein n=1 Tax=Kribbella antiqua TaxID=2512217 RepID=A0A4V2S582_9ACTN|nr:hypothetical protein [Kribbella antiqua]TCO51080.1 hypothetical protein EV646_10162 [Kribbella antiqua]
MADEAARTLSDGIAGDLEAAKVSLRNAAQTVEKTKLRLEQSSYTRTLSYQLTAALSTRQVAEDEFPGRHQWRIRARDLSRSLSEAVETARRTLSGPSLNRLYYAGPPALGELNKAVKSLESAQRGLESLQQIEGHDQQLAKVLSDRVNLLSLAATNARDAAQTAVARLESVETKLKSVDATMSPARLGEPEKTGVPSLEDVHQRAHTDLTTADLKVQETDKWLTVARHPAVSVADESTALAAHAGLNPPVSLEKRQPAASGEQERRSGYSTESSRDRGGRG